MAKKILIILLVLLVLAQFFQPLQNNGSATSTTDITHAVPVPDSIMAILKVSCYDCHSDHTNYPWYSKIMPASWWLSNHIREGKQVLNFTTFTTYSFRKQLRRMGAISEAVDKREMPLPSYLWIHTKAKFNEAQKKMIMDWADGAKEKIMKDSLSKLIRH